MPFLATSTPSVSPNFTGPASSVSSISTAPLVALSSRYDHMQMEVSMKVFTWATFNPSLKNRLVLSTVSMNNMIKRKEQK